MNLASLIPAFNDAAYNVGLNLLADLMIVGGGAIFLSYKYNKKVKNLEESKLHSKDVSVQHTRFEPTGRLNFKTGGEYWALKIRPAAKNTDLAALMPEEYRDLLVPHLMAAMADIDKKASAKQPYSINVLDHLRYVVPEKQYNSIMNLFMTKFVGRAGEDQLEVTRAAPTKPNFSQREVWEEVPTVRILTYEPGAQKREMRVLEFPASVLKDKNGFPDSSHILFEEKVEDPQGGWKFELVDKKDHRHALRLQTCIDLAHAFRERNGIFVLFQAATGGVARIPEPPSEPRL